MGLGSFVSNAVKAAGKITRPISKPIGDVLKPVTKTAEKLVVKPVINPIAKEIENGITKVQNIPVAGQLFNIATGVHIFDGADRIIKGERIDKAVLKSFKGQMREYTQLAPYAASIVSFVPAVGPGVGGAIAAAGALAEGRPLSQVALAAVKGAIPGGAIAQAAFDIATAAAQGKPIEQVAIAGLPVDNKTKQAIAAAAALTKDLAQGKRVDTALMRRIDDAVKLLPPQMAKAVNLGTAVGVAKNIQDAVGKAVNHPQVSRDIKRLGKLVSSSDKLLKAGRELSKDPKFKEGYDLGIGLIKGNNVTQSAIAAARAKLPGPAKKGFDEALALVVGRNTNQGKTIRAKSPKEAAAYLMTLGVAGAAQNQKVGIIKDLAQSPETREGAKNAIKAVAAARDQRTLWDIIKSVFGF